MDCDSIHLWLAFAGGLPIRRRRIADQNVAYQKEANTECGMQKEINSEYCISRTGKYITRQREVCC